MRTVVASSDHPFYLWQVLVQVQHFIERGELDQVDWAFYHSTRTPSEKALQIAEVTGARFSFWKDPRRTVDYNPMMKPWLVGKMVARDPELRMARFHYLDPDVMLTQPGDFYDQAPSWAGSPTDSYTGPGYLRSHGEDLWLDLCKIAGVDPERAAQIQGAGAQWVVDYTDAQFWQEVADASLEMFHRCLRQIKRPEHQYAVQAWCAEMYATQLVALAYGFPVQPDPALSFLWANGPAADWNLHGYFHDAGVPHSNGVDFCKISYQSSPFGKKIPVAETSASYHYVELIRRTEQAWPQLVW